MHDLIAYLALSDVETEALIAISIPLIDLAMSVKLWSSESIDQP